MNGIYLALSYLACLLIGMSIGVIGTAICIANAECEEEEEGKSNERRNI